MSMLSKYINLYYVACVYCVYWFLSDRLEDAFKLAVICLHQFLICIIRALLEIGSAWLVACVVYALPAYRL